MPEIKELTEIFQSLSDPSRLKIMMLLSEQGEMTVSDLVKKTGMLQTTVSHHLGILRKRKLVTPRQEQRYRYYSINTLWGLQLSPMMAALFGWQFKGQLKILKQHE